MKVHTNDFKNNIKTLGREINIKITYEENGQNIILGNEEINNVNLNYQGKILKSIMKTLVIDSNVFIEKGKEINFQFGIKVGNNFEYLNYGNFIVDKIEAKEDTKSWQITCHDKMLNFMTDYTSLDIIFPITIRDYLNALIVSVGLEFENNEDEFANYDKIIDHELYLDNNGENIGYTKRDILDELAQVTASIICVNETNGKIKLKYPTDTNDTIDEEFLKNVNVNFGEKFGPVNSVVLARSADSDMIYLQDTESIEENGLCEVKISENQIMNFNDRDEFLPDILEKLSDIEYYINDFSSTGICYLEIGDIYNISIDENNYQCIMFNDEINISNGVEENIHCEKLEESKSDYTKANKTDRKINQTTLIVDKHEQTIQGLVRDMYDENGVVNENFTQIYQDINNITTHVQNSGGGNLLKNSVMFSIENDLPTDWDITGTGTLTIQSSSEAINAGGIAGNIFILNDKKATQRIIVKVDDDSIPANEKTYYTFSTKIKKGGAGSCYVKISNPNEEYIIQLNNGETSFYGEYEIAGLLPKFNYYDVEFYGSSDSDATFTDNMFALGTYKSQWQQANGEIMNSQVTVDINGIKVQSSVYAGNETVITPLEFAGYALIDGIKKKIFSLNNDTTEVEKIKSRKEINMTPIKIIPITTGNLQGWAFIPNGDDN